MEQERIVECVDWAAGIVELSKKDGVLFMCVQCSHLFTSNQWSSA